jgi:hypothetical protein
VLLGIALGGALLCEAALLLINLVPATVWASMGYSSNGPLPDKLNPLIAGLFYVLPAVIGALCRRWQVAVVLATLPAWLDLAIFAVATAGRYGPFNLAGDKSSSTIGTLELFAVLGALGWLARSAALLTLSDRRASDRSHPSHPGGQGDNRP